MICARAGRHSQIRFSVLPLILFFLVVSLSASVANAAIINVPAGGNLQSAINNAQPGDTIILEAGASYIGTIVLPNKTGTSFITIQSSALAQLPGAAERVTPTHASLMPKILSPGANQAALQTAAYAHHYRFVGIEFAPVNATVIVNDLIKLGDGSSAQNSLAMVPHHLVLDRCYIHGFPTMELKRGIALNSAETDILNSYISDVHGVGYDTQAICGWNGPGPFRIINNYLEAAGENVMFGGADPWITGLIPSDITIRQNHFFKPLSWKVGDPSYAGIHWTVKNLFETKNARRVLVDGNLFENCWQDAQVGFAILLKSNNQDSTAPWSVTEDLTFSNNIVRNTEHGLNILAVEVPPKISAVGNNIRIVNNLWDVRKIWYQGSNGAVNLLFDHNTFFTRDGNTATLYGLVTQDFVFRNNLGVRAGYGIKGDGTGEGIAALNIFCPGWIFENNVIVGASPTLYPTNNSYPSTLTEVGFVDLNGGNYRLSSSSPYRNGGTDGKDIGVDFDALNAALGGAPVDSPTPTPTATPTPTPTATATPTPTPTPTPIVVSITTPLMNSVFSLGTAISVNANVADSAGQITSVKFYANSQLVGTDVSAPYAISWTSMNSGSYDLTAKAEDDRGLSTNSSPITVKISKALRGVRNTRKNSETITTSVSDSNVNSAQSSTTSTSEQLDLLTLDVEQTYRDFSDERLMFASSERIDNYLYAAMFLVRSSAALSKSASASSGILNRLKKVDAYLSFCEDLMLKNEIAASSITAADRVNAWTKIVIGQPDTKPQSSSSVYLTRNGTGRISSTSPLTPLSTQTASSGNEGSYELAGVTVSINGKAVALLSVSPSVITFRVPSDAVGGLGDVIVTAQDGNISHGASSVMGLNPTFLSDFANGNGAATNGLTIGSKIYTTTATTFGGSDNRTRLAVWATGLSTGLTNVSSSNDVRLPDGSVIVNFAESVRVEARTSDGKVFDLPVEFAGATGILSGLDQVNIILRPELAGAGTVQLTIVCGGVRGNTASVVIR